MDFINLILIVIVALSSTPITIMSGSVTNRSYSTTNSYTSVAPSAQKGIFPPSVSTDSKDDLICRTCKRLSEHHTCCVTYICVDLYFDRFNCGSCGLVCKLGARCCGGICVDIRKDNGNCGKCYNGCSPGRNCSFGFCVSA
ncbi:protein STIG1-like [Capsicum chacoense]